jgi:glycosyltransferase involved in cell wall biosynthesis
MKEGLVSVVIPTFGRPILLKRCINSVNLQTYDQIEIIIVDDNGRGQMRQLETAEIISSINCRFPINYVIHDENQGGAVARNTGAKVAKGEFIALLDDDDEAECDRILKQVRELKLKNDQNSKIKACTCLVKRKKNGQEVDRQTPKIKTNYLFELLALNSSLYSGSTLLIFTHSFTKLNGFDELFRRNQDLEFMIRFFARYDVTVLNEHLAVLNIDDRSNIPSYQRILETKQLFLEKFDPIISKLPSEQQREIYKNNALEIAKVALWNKKIFGFLRGVREAKLTLNELGYFIRDGFGKLFMHVK